MPIDVSDDPSAYYTPSTDRIHMPPAQTFLSASEYLSTLAHEMGHAVGHKTRLNRVHEGNSRERYAKEEVEVELAAAMVVPVLAFTTVLKTRPHICKAGLMF